MENLDLFRVYVSQEWYLEACAIVLAPDQKTARSLAEGAVDFDDDYRLKGTIGPIASPAEQEPLDENFADILDDDDLWLIFPNGESCEPWNRDQLVFRDGEPCEPWNQDQSILKKFLAYLTPDNLKLMRQKRIESQNGQLDIPSLTS